VIKYIQDHHQGGERGVTITRGVHGVQSIPKILFATWRKICWT